MFATLLSYAFRPLFLLNSLFAIGAILLWALMLNGALPTLQPDQPLLWHGHEMLVGFALATIAGFLLTAVATWTGLPPVRGMALGVLCSAWLAGRLVMLFAASLPYVLVACVDMLFPVLLVVLIGREVITGGSRRNYPIVVITSVIALLNMVYHLGVAGVLNDTARPATLLLVHLVLLLITVIAGRIIPNFTANWMRAHEKHNPPTVHIGIDRGVLAITLLTGVAASLAPLSLATGGLAAAAAALHTLRLARWRTAATLTEPLLLVLHVAYAWLPVGYALTALVAFGVTVPQGAALHALTMGAIGVMILAVTTRVALAHTGRPLHASRLAVFAYWVLNLAVATRVLGPLLSVDYLAVINSAAAGWILSFAVFLWVYWPVLTGPRVDA